MDSQTQTIIIQYLMPYQPEMIGIFGSYSRNEQTAESDLDILISLKSPVTLLDLAKIKRQLSEKLNIKVDLVSQTAVHPKLKAYIEQDLKVIYHA
jgi:uncharacterized protein